MNRRERRKTWGDQTDMIPRNHARAWLRVVLWILPTGFAWMSAVGLSMLSGRRGFPGMTELIMPLWFVLNIAFVVGVGWYNKMLSSRADAGPNGRDGRVVLFFVIQIFLIPLLSALVLFAICASGSFKL